MSAGERRVSGAIERLLAAPPFGLSDEDKKPLFAAAMTEAFRHHYEGSELFRRLCRLKGMAPDALPDELGELPFLPASEFKRGALTSVPAGTIVSEVLSSATTGFPSRIPIDRTTARRQSLVSARIMAEYLGHHRRPFLVVDVDPGASACGRDIPARAAAARGFLVFADAVDFALEDEAVAASTGGPTDRLLAIFDRLCGQGRDVCVFGFTHLLYTRLIRPFLESGKAASLPAGSRVAVIGGWKRLREASVDRTSFLGAVGRVLSVPEDNIIDFYGFTEQMGIVHAGAGRAPKTISAYAEIIIRDFDSLRPAADGREGLIQILTPVPHSYPGISVLTDDVGRIVGRGRDSAGRWGTRFEILGRAEGAEPRGCGDLDGPAKKTSGGKRQSG